MSSKSIIKRLKEYLRLKTDKALAEKLGVDPSTISAWKTRDSIDYQLIINKVDGINYNWLITGKGNLGLYDDVSLNTISVKEFVKLQSQGSSLPVVLIPETAVAGYEKGFSENKFETLPIISFKDYKDGNRFRCFEIVGESMESTIYSGDYVFCERIERSQKLKEGAIYVLHTTDGLLCKRIEIKDKSVLLHSEHKKYSPKSVNKGDIIEIWKVIWLHREMR